MLRAWRGFDRFEGRAALRSWPFRIATNVCLDMLKGRERRKGAAPSGRSTTRPYDVSRLATVAGSKLPPLRTITVGCSPLPDGTRPVR
jgi:RNA polymerase sigma-70 factor, ECF subfamily